MNGEPADNRNAEAAEENGLFRFSVSEDEAGRRLDALLAELLHARGEELGYWPRAF